MELGGSARWRQRNNLKVRLERCEGLLGAAAVSVWTLMTSLLSRVSVKAAPGICKYSEVFDV